MDSQQVRRNPEGGAETPAGSAATPGADPGAVEPGAVEPGAVEPGAAAATAASAEHAAVGPLGRTLRRGATISAFTLVLVQVTSLVTTLALARLLSPEEIGIYAAGTVLTGFLVMFAEGGLRGALIQRQTEVEDAADTVFWATAATGVAMSLTALAAAPLVAWFFSSALAGEIAAVTSGMLLMQALTNVPDGLLQRQFNFRRRLIVDPARSIAFGAMAVVLAYLGFGVWSLAIGNYFSMAVWLAGTWILGRWRPGRGRPSYRLWRDLARFAYPLLIQSLVWQVREAGQAALVGRFLGAGSLGQFRYGRRVGLLPTQAVVQVGSYVLFPAFSRLADDSDRLKQAFLRSLRWLWIATAPVAAMIVALGEPAVVILLGDRWREAGVFLVAMAGYGATIGLKATANEVIKGSGRSRLLNRVSIVQLVLGLGLVCAALPFGLFAVGLAISATEMALALMAMLLARSVIGYSLTEMVRLIVPPLTGSVAALAVIGLLDRLIIQADDFSGFLGVGVLGAEVLGFLLIYFAVLRVLDPIAVLGLLGISRKHLQKIRPGRGGRAPSRRVPSRRVP
jgi:PST family polysaccharide transporter